MTTLQAFHWLLRGVYVGAPLVGLYMAWERWRERRYWT